MAALNTTALLSVLTVGVTGKVYGLIHLLTTNLGIRKIRYLEECLILNAEINQLELVQPLMCLIKPSSTLWLDPSLKMILFSFSSSSETINSGTTSNTVCREKQLFSIQLLLAVKLLSK